MSLISENDCMAQELLCWFRRNGRNLPWRRTYNPYHVWISEIMLQQTQMDRGVEYFVRWMKRFPKVAEVAAAPEQEVLKYWQGLGYYARARNLHRAAKKIVDEFAGEVPCGYDQLLTLPGIGAYTAAAIASVAGNHDIPVVDANVSRVYARIYDIGQPVKDKRVQQRIATIAEKHLPAGKARAFNQALMDFGALVCKPRKPRCEACPVARWCQAFQQGTTLQRPVAVPKKKIIDLQKVAGLIVNNGRIFIQQRKRHAVWGGLWEFPGGELTGIAGKEDALVHQVFNSTGFSIKVVQPITTVEHHYTRYRVTLHSYLCALSGPVSRPVLRDACDYRWVFPDEVEAYGFPAGPRKILEHIAGACPDLLHG
ncbi:MAG: A/G-specific adenine glycosylase [Desulforhopalus sp.]